MNESTPRPEPTSNTSSPATIYVLNASPCLGTGRHLSIKLDRYLYRIMEIHAFPGKGIKSVFF
jgi:hypothetical protein